MNLESMDEEATMVGNTIEVRTTPERSFGIVSDNARYAEFLTGLPVRLVFCEAGRVKAVVTVGGCPLNINLRLEKDEGGRVVKFLTAGGDNLMELQGEVSVEESDGGGSLLQINFLYQLDLAPIAAEQISPKAVEAAIGVVLEAMKKAVEAAP